MVVNVGICDEWVSIKCWCSGGLSPPILRRFSSYRIFCPVLPPPGSPVKQLKQLNVLAASRLEKKPFVIIMGDTQGGYGVGPRREKGTPKATMSKVHSNVITCYVALLFNVISIIVVFVDFVYYCCFCWFIMRKFCDSETGNTSDTVHRYSRAENKY